MEDQQELYERAQRGGQLQTGPDGEVVEVPAHKGARPKYLVRDDGVVQPYTDVLAAHPRFTPTNSLPEKHLAGLREAAAREVRTKKASQMAREAHVQLVAERAKQHEDRMDTHLQDVKAAKVDQEDQFQVDEAFVTKSSKKVLVAYALKEHDVDLSDCTTAEARDEVRSLMSSSQDTE